MAAILSAFAIPSFINSIRTTRGVSDANGILAVVTLARSEAIKRDAYVCLCTSTNGTSCAASGTSWDQGYLVFLDANNDGSCGTTGITPLRTEYPLSTASTIIYTTSVAPSTLTTLSFTGVGQLTSGQAGHFDIKPSGKTVGERYVVVRQIGRANVCTPTNANCGP